jgi:hypothetical protein
MNPLIGFGSGRKKGPYAVNYCGYARGLAATYSGTVDCGIPYADRSIWIGLIGPNPVGVSSVTVGGVAATSYYSFYHCAWWKAVRVPGQSVTISVTGVSPYTTMGIYSVTGAVNGADTAPAVYANYNNNSNDAPVNVPCAVNDQIVGLGTKSGASFGNFNGWSQLIVNDLKMQPGAASSAGCWGRSPIITTAGTYYIDVSGTDSSKAIEQLVLRFSKAA